MARLARLGWLDDDLVHEGAHQGKSVAAAPGWLWRAPSAMVTDVEAGAAGAVPAVFHLEGELDGLDGVSGGVGVLDGAGDRFVDRVDDVVDQVGWPARRVQPGPDLGAGGQDRFRACGEDDAV